MSDLALENILTQDGLKSIPADTIIEGTARLDLAYNAVSNTINKGFNVSSVTEAAGAGQLVVNITNSFADNFFSVAAFGGKGDGSGNYAGGHLGTPPTVNKYGFFIANQSGSVQSCVYTNSTVTGKLA